MGNWRSTLYSVEKVKIKKANEHRLFLKVIMVGLVGILFTRRFAPPSEPATLALFLASSALGLASILIYANLIY